MDVFRPKVGGVRKTSIGSDVVDLLGAEDIEGKPMGIAPSPKLGSKAKNARKPPNRETFDENFHLEALETITRLMQAESEEMRLKQQENKQGGRKGGVDRGKQKTQRQERKTTNRGGTEKKGKPEVEESKLLETGLSGQQPNETKPAVCRKLCPQGHLLGEFANSHRERVWCDGCKKMMPLHSISHGCRVCNYDLCAQCGSISPGFNPGETRNAVVPLAASRGCPQGHALIEFRTLHDRVRCDQCQLLAPLHGAMHGCRLCNWDLCNTCYSGEGQAIVIPDARRCPHGHSLKEMKTPSEGFRCDDCERIVHTDSIIHRCTPCGFALCTKCLTWQNDKDPFAVGDTFMTMSPTIVRVQATKASAVVMKTQAYQLGRILRTGDAVKPRRMFVEICGQRGWISKEAENGIVLITKDARLFSLSEGVSQDVLPINEPDTDCPDYWLPEEPEERIFTDVTPPVQKSQRIARTGSD